MKLKNVMREGFLREFNSPSFLPNELSISKSVTPCSVESSTGWEESSEFFAKVFSFSSRISQHSFLEYIFDLEQQHGIRVSLNYVYNKDEVEITVPRHMMASNHFKAFLSEVDNIYYDVSASFNGG